MYLGPTGATDLEREIKEREDEGENKVVSGVEK